MATAAKFFAKRNQIFSNLELKSNNGKIYNSFDYMEKDGHKYYINHINMRRYRIFGIKT